MNQISLLSVFLFCMEYLMIFFQKVVFFQYFLEDGNSVVGTVIGKRSTDKDQILFVQEVNHVIQGIP